MDLHSSLSDMNIFHIITSLCKWILICITVVPCITLLWKILRRKNLHTLFNLGMCLFFFIIVIIFPFLITEYTNLLKGMIEHSDIPSPESCHMLYLYRMLINQAIKVVLLNLVFRYIIIRFSHYGMGLSHSFSHGGTKHRVLKFTYFTFLLTYTAVGFFNACIKSYREEMMENIVKGRICMFLRCVYCQFKQATIIVFITGWSMTRTTQGKHLTHMLCRDCFLSSLQLYGELWQRSLDGMLSPLFTKCVHKDTSLL